jgi:hypothetical protein
MVASSATQAALIAASASTRPLCQTTERCQTAQYGLKMLVALSALSLVQPYQSITVELILPSRLRYKWRVKFRYWRRRRSEPFFMRRSWNGLQRLGERRSLSISHMARNFGSSSTLSFLFDRSSRYSSILFVASLDPPGDLMTTWAPAINLPGALIFKSKSDLTVDVGKGAPNFRVNPEPVDEYNSP